MKKLSIIIPVLDNWVYTRYCLDNFKNLNKDDYEIIIVDNGSKDSTFKEIDKYITEMTNLVYIRNSENTGFGFACGRGYKASSGEAILFLNNDIKITDKNFTWLDAYVNNVLSSDKNELVGPTGGLVDVESNFEFIYETNNADDGFNYLSGWFIMGKKTVFDTLVLPNQEGPFDTLYFVYFEDTDLSFRAKLNGISLRLLSVPIVHIKKQTSKHLNTAKLYLDSKSKFLDKWSGQASKFMI